MCKKLLLFFKKYTAFILIAVNYIHKINEFQKVYIAWKKLVNFLAAKLSIFWIKIYGSEIIFFKLK